MTVVAVAHADAARLCERLRALVGACDAVVVVCDVGALEADLAAVEVLARLRLTARRLGCGLRLRGASRALEQMVVFCGLCDVLAAEDEPGLIDANPSATSENAPGSPAGLGRDGGEAEEREHPGGVEERVDAGDPPA